MKKRIFLNLVIGISLIATPAFLLASCSAQASDVKLQITVKATPGIITVPEVKAESITFTTVQKIFDIVESDFVNVKATLKNTNVGVNQNNQVVLTANEGFVFEDGTNTLDSVEFTLSNATLPITLKAIPDGISAEEVLVSPITFTTVQKVFDIAESDFVNVTATYKNAAASLTNQIVLTANEGFVFEGGANTLDSAIFDLSKQLAITAKTLEEAAPFIPHAEIIASPIALLTIQKLFNIVQSDFENIDVSFTEEIVPGMGNQMVLTAKKGFIFKNGTNTLLSEWFTVQGKTSK